jgi:hypothetical protein
MKRIVNRNFKISLNFLENSQKTAEILPFYAKARIQSIKIGNCYPQNRSLATALQTEIGESETAIEGRCAS